MNNVRIAIRDSTDSHNVAFFDNVAGIKYKKAEIQRFLAGSASILTLKYNSKDIDSIRSGCKLAFRYKARDYWLNIMKFEKQGFEVEITACSLHLEMNNEERGAHKPDKAMSFAEYLAYYDPEHSVTLGINQVSDKKIKLEWTGTDTILARLFSIANSFDAELEFVTELNDDYSLKRHVLNVYKKGNLGSNKTSSPVRVGKELKVINYSDSIEDLRTAVRATGKDGLTIDGLNKKIYDDNKELLYYSSGMTVYAPQSRDRFPSVGKGSNDNWIVEDLGETQYETKEALWGYMYGEIQKICLPKIEYKVTGAIDSDVGDTQTLIDDVHYEPPLYLKARVSELTDDILQGKVIDSTFINFERQYSQIADSLLKQVEALAEDAAPYIVRLSTDNGYNFKNGQGSSTITAKLEKYSKIVNADWKWLINNSIISETSSVTINASQIVGTLNVVAVATVDGNEVAREYITFTNSDDGVGIKSIKRYYTTNDQAEGVTAGGQNWSTKPTTVTADNNYMWSYDVITYTNDTSLVTEPAVIGARGDDGLDADTTGITEALDKAKQELTALSANIEKVRDDSLAAVEEAKQQLATVANDLSKAKTNLQNAVSAVDAKATNLQSDLTKAKQDLTSQASQLQAQASAQSELTKRVSSVEETANGTKTTVSELSKTIDSNTKNITSVTARTKVVEDDLLNTKTTMSQVQTTANSTSQKAATLETGLNGLSAKFSNLRVGGVNLIKQSTAQKDLRLGMDAVPINDGNHMLTDWIKIEPSTVYTLTTYEDVTETNMWYSLAWYSSNVNDYSGWISRPTGAATAANLKGGKQYTSPANATYAKVSYPINYPKVKLERGNIATDYSPSEADIEQKVADYKQTADQNYASLQTTVQNLDGTVQQNKTTAEQTAAGFKTRIESLETYKNSENIRANQYFESAKTETARQLTAERTAIAKDYVAKSTYTSDVTGIRNDLSETTTTASATKTNLANYQASNDKAVANLQSNLQTANGNISSLKTKVEAVPGQITSAVSAVEGKIPKSLGGRNLIIRSQIQNGYIDANGNLTTATSQFTTGFIDGTNSKQFTITAPKFVLGNLEWLRLAKYDTNKNFMGRDVISYNKDAKTVKNIDLADNVAYFKVSFDGAYGELFKIERGSLATDWSPAPEDAIEEISSLSSQIQQTADGMTLLATKTELNTAKSDLQSGITTATNKANAAQSTADNNAQTISTHTTQISALNTGLSAKVSQTDFNTLSGRVTTAENNIIAKANELSSQISSVSKRIPSEIGAVNLIKQSTAQTGLRLGMDAVPINDGNHMLTDWIKIEPSTVYTLTTYEDVTETNMWYSLAWYSSNVNDYSGWISRPTGAATAANLKGGKQYTSPANATYAKVSYPINYPKVKLERGNIATDYSPSPEDYDSALSTAKSEIKQTTDAITASVSSVQTAASNAQSTANTAVSKADAAQAGVNTLDSTTVKTATLNLDNNGFVTKVGKTVNGNTFATMIAQNESDVQIIAKKMKVSGDMIVNGAITAEKLNVSNLSAVNSNLGKIEGGSLLLQENKAASSSIDSWGTFNRPAHKQGLYMDNHGLASSGAIQRKNSGETMPTDMPLAVLQSGELRFLVVDYNDNLENVLHYGLSDPDFGAIRFEIDSELKRRLTMTSSGYLNFQATNYTNWTSTGVSGCEYMIQGRLVLVNYDVTFNSAGTHTIGGIPQEFTKKSLMMTAKAWTITPRDKNIQLNSDGTLHILDAEANVNYRGTLVFSY
ncbi:Chromosome partition protein Smc [Streptococcus infantarius subsp. infantarius]|nr:Chromosome partition protein Smc [Streptococcus infantarius subsp. infantarius]